MLIIHKLFTEFPYLMFPENNIPTSYAIVFRITRNFLLFFPAGPLLRFSSNFCSGCKNQQLRTFLFFPYADSFFFCGFTSFSYYISRNPPFLCDPFLPVMNAVMIVPSSLGLCALISPPPNFGFSWSAGSFSFLEELWWSLPGFFFS